jgi:hypothetical protein
MALASVGTVAFKTIAPDSLRDVATTVAWCTSKPR